MPAARSASRSAAGRPSGSSAARPCRAASCATATTCSWPPSRNRARRRFWMASPVMRPYYWTARTREGAPSAPPSCGSRRAFRSLLPGAAPEVEREEPPLAAHRADAEVAEALREDDGAVHRGLHPLVHDQHRAGVQAGAPGDVLACLPDPVALTRVAVTHDALAPRLTARRVVVEVLPVAHVG